MPLFYKWKIYVRQSRGALYFFLKIREICLSFLPEMICKSTKNSKEMQKYILRKTQKILGGYSDGKSERTIEVYGNSVKEFFRWFSHSYGTVEFKKLYRENILEYKSYLKNVKKSLYSGNNLCPKSINSKLSALICFNELMGPDNIVISKKDLIKIQAEIVCPTSITKKEIEEFRQIVLQDDGCAARRNFAIVTILAYTDIACTENHYYRNRRSIDTKSQIISSIPEFQVK